MRVLAPALLMSFLVAAATTASAQYPCSPCQPAAVGSPPAAYYYPAPYAVPTYYACAPPVYYVPTMVYVPVPVKCDAPVYQPGAAPEKPTPSPDPILDSIPAIKGAAWQALTGRATTGERRVYHRILDVNDRFISSTPFFRQGMATDDASMRSYGFTLVDRNATSTLEAASVTAARELRLKEGVAKHFEAAIKAEGEKVASAKMSAFLVENEKAKQTNLMANDQKQDELALKIDKLTKAINALSNKLPRK